MPVKRVKKSGEGMKVEKDEFLQRVRIARNADSCTSSGDSVRPSFRHIPVFCRDDDHQVGTLKARVKERACNGLGG